MFSLVTATPAFLVFGSVFVLWLNLNVVVMLAVLRFGLASVLFGLVLTMLMVVLWFSSGLILALGGLVS